MADKRVSVAFGADVSEFQAAATTFAKNLNLLTGNLKEFGIGMQRVNKDGVETVRVVQGLTDAGEKIYVTFRKVKETFEAVGATMSKTNRTAQELATNLKAALAAKGTQAVGELENTFKPENLNPAQLSSYQAAISKIINLFREGKISVEQFNKILGDLKKDPNKIISDLTTAENSLAKAIRDVAKASNEAAVAETKRVNDAKAKAQQKIDATLAEKNIRTIVPTEGFDVGKLNQYEAALQKIKAAIESGAISLKRFKELFEKVKLNPKAIIPDLNEQEQKIVASLRVITGGLKETRNASDRLSEAFSISFSGIIRLLEALTIKKFASSLLAEFERSITAAKDFSIKIAEVRTISQQANVSTGEWASGINKLSTEFGNTRADIAEAAYQNLSNQVTKGKDTFSLLRTELEFSKAAVTNAATSTNLITAAMNSFRIPTGQADKVAAGLFKTIEVGRLRADSIANTFGRVGAVAHAAGVSFEETAAATATLTRQGITAQDAMTLLTNVLTQIIQPTSKLNDFLKEQIGISGQAAVAQKGFVGILDLLDKESQKNSDSTSELTNNLRTLRGLIGLKGDAFSQFADNLKQITNSTESYNVAIKEVQNSLGNKFQRQIEQLKIGLQESFGTPVLEGIVKFGEIIGGDKGIAGGLSKLGSVLKFSGIAIAGYYTTIGVATTATKVWSVATAIQAAETLTLSRALTVVGFGISNVTSSISNFLAANPFILITAGFTAGYVAMEKFQDYLKSTSASVEELTKTFEANSSRTKFLENLSNIEGKRLTELTNNTRSSYDEQYKTILKFSGDVVKLSDSVKKQVIENTKALAEQLSLSAKTFIDRLRQNIDQLNSEATKSKTLIQESKKVSEDLNKKGADTIFNEKLKNAYGGEQGLDLFPNQKLILIKNRIQEVTKFARQEAQKGTQESITESRKYYDELENLEKQKFELVNAQRKAQFEQRVAKGEETPIGFDQNGQARYLFISQTKELETKINQLTKERLATEQQIRKVQEEAQQKKLAAAVQEKERVRELQQIINQVAEYQSKIYDEEGKIRPEFLKNPEKIEKDFQDKINSIQELAGPEAAKNDLRFFLDLNKQKVAFVKQTQAAIKTIEAEALQERIAALKKANDETVTNTEKAIKKTGEAIQTQSNELNKFIKTTAQSALKLAEKDKPIFDKPSKTLTDLRQTQEAANEARKIFENNKSPENVKAYADAVQNLIDKIDAYTKSSVKLKENQGRLPDDNQSVKTRLDQARKTVQDLIENVNKKEGAEQIFENITKKAQELDAAIKKIPNKINEFGPASQNARDLIRNNFKGIEDDATKLTEKLAEIVAQLKQLGANIPVLKNPAPGAAAIPPAAGQMFGGIVKQYFSSGGMVGRHRSHYDTGGWIGMNPRGSDNVPIMAAKDEFVVNADAAKKFAPLLQKINSKDYSDSSSETKIASIGDIHVNVHGGATDEITVRKIAQGLRRELKRGTITLD